MLPSVGLFISLISIILGPVGLFFQEESWSVVWTYSIPMKSILYLLLSIIAFIAFYNLSIDQHKSYGRFVKSIFDLHRYRPAKASRLKYDAYKCNDRRF